MFAVKKPTYKPRNVWYNISQIYLTASLQAQEYRGFSCVFHGWICSSQPCCGSSINVLNCRKLLDPFFQVISNRTLTCPGMCCGECWSMPFTDSINYNEKRRKRAQVDPRSRLSGPHQRLAAGGCSVHNPLNASDSPTSHSRGRMMYGPVFADHLVHSDLSFHSPWFYEPLALVTASR